MKFTTRRFIYTLTALSVLFIGSCSSSTEPSTDFPEVEGFDAEIGENTAYVPEHITDAGLNSYDEENQVFRFDADVISDTDLNLEPGAILLIEGLALRKISSVTESGGELIIETEFATLNEAFESASIESVQSLDFTVDRLSKSKVEFMGRIYSPSSVANNTVSWEGSSGDFTFEIEVTAKQTEVDIIMLVKYDTGNFSGAMRSESNLKGFDQEISIEIENYNTEWFRSNSANFAGSMDLYFVMAGGVSNERSFVPDFPKFLFPFAVGPIPMLLELGTIFVTQFNLGVNGTATMGTSFSYSGDMGFEFNGVSFTPIVEGGVNNPATSSAEGNAAGFSGVVNGQYGIALPNISLRIVGVPTGYIRQEFYIGSLYAFPACTELYSNYKINAGITLGNPLGFSFTDLSRDFNIVDVNPHSYRSDGCDPNKMSEFEFVTIPAEYLPGQQVPFK